MILENKTPEEIINNQEKIKEAIKILSHGTITILQVKAMHYHNFQIILISMLDYQKLKVLIIDNL